MNTAPPTGLDALHPDDRERLAAQWRQAIVALSSFAGEARLRDAAGAYRWFMLAFNARQDGMALELSWYPTATDIHPQMLQRQQNVQALSSSKTCWTPASTASK